MSDETKKYGDKHLPHHLFKARLWVELLQVAELRGERIADLESQLAESQRHNELLRAVAVAAEWSARFESCPICDAMKLESVDSHRDDCPYKAALDGGAMGE